MGGLRHRFSYWRRIFSIKTLYSNLGYRLNGAPDGLPLPPPNLMYQVSGNISYRNYLNASSRVGTAIRETLSAHNLGIEHFDSVLDFGCGCGRAMRNWQGLEHVSIHGCDVNSGQILWCRSALPFAEYTTSDLRPPLAYRDDRFSFVYGISVFTHLEEELQKVWLEELHRILQPRGYLFVTTLGNGFRDKMNAEEALEYDRNNVVVRLNASEMHNVPAVWNPPEQFHGELSKFFDLIEFIPGARQGRMRQDIHLVQKRVLIR